MKSVFEKYLSNTPKYANQIQIFHLVVFQIQIQIQIFAYLNTNTNTYLTPALAQIQRHLVVSLGLTELTLWSPDDVAMTLFTDWCHEYFLENCPHANATRPHWWFYWLVLIRKQAVGCTIVDLSLSWEMFKSSSTNNTFCDVQFFVLIFTSENDVFKMKVADYILLRLQWVNLLENPGIMLLLLWRKGFFT